MVEVERECTVTSQPLALYLVAVIMLRSVRDKVSLVSTEARHVDACACLRVAVVSGYGRGYDGVD